MDTIDIFAKEYAGLNVKQKEVVDAIDGPVMVVAGPGTGKTQVLALRAANILRERDVQPNNILCLTFTDAGAINMRERLEHFIGKDAYRVGIYTFHAFSSSVISRHPEYFYNAANYTAADSLASAQIMEDIFANLPHKHPLSSPHPEGGWVYHNHVQSRIDQLKKAGYSPKKYRAMLEKLQGEPEAITTLLEKWPARLSIKNISEVVTIADSLASKKGTYAEFLAKSLVHAIEAAVEIGKTGPVGDWKSKFTEKGDDGRLLLKDAEPKRWEKIIAVAELYNQYEEALHTQALYDFGDMIIDVAEALEKDATLRNMLEEQYQYILVDEFQDTNGAQLGLIKALSSNEVHEGRPNVMVVGDDDQAVFKFQGADVSNIHAFTNMYTDVKKVVLDTNYRSHKTILDTARAVVLQGDNRLENSLGITKELSQGNNNIKLGSVDMMQYGSDVEEYAQVAKKVRAAIDAGTHPQEIAIIANKHRQLIPLLSYLEKEGVPYAYERSQNVFDEVHVRELIDVCAFVASVTGEVNRRDDLLPRILAYPSWGIPRVELFHIAIAAKEQYKSWTEIISTSTNDAVIRAFTLLAELSADAEITPLEHLLDRYMRESGFREYHFGIEALQKHPAQYVIFLASLKTFIEAVRTWRNGDPLFARDVAPFVALHEKNNIRLISTSSFIQSASAVQVMSAHKSKGLEFDTVFIVGTHDKVWAKAGMANIAPIPAPLVPEIAPAGEDEDDFIRILYVALTRAKSALYISGHEPLVRYLAHDGVVHENNLDMHSIASAHEPAVGIEVKTLSSDERAVLEQLLANYRLSVTHLNSFLDISRDGPKNFLTDYILRFPQPMNVPSAYGSAIDKALSERINYPKYNAGDIPTLDHIFGVFRRSLMKSRLPDVEMKKQVARGEKVLADYLAVRGEYFQIEDETQVDFKNDGIVVEGAPLTGKLDFFRTVNSEYEVIDFKTGKESSAWDAKGMSEPDKIKLHKYKQQLAFYKLLIRESSRHSLPVSLLALEFVEHIKDGTPVRLAYDPTDAELDRLALLIGAVYNKITTLNFPDTTTYDQNLKGIVQFEDDLIAGVV